MNQCDLLLLLSTMNVFSHSITHTQAHMQVTQLTNTQKQSNYLLWTPPFPSKWPNSFVGGASVSSLKLMVVLMELHRCSKRSRPTENHTFAQTIS